MGFVELCFLGLFAGEEVVPHTLHVHWLTWLTRTLETPVVQDLLGRRHVEPNQGQLKVEQNIFEGLICILVWCLALF